MWAADVNARGALLGRPVEIVYYDDRSRDAGTVEGFTKLIGQDNVDVLVGPYSSSLTLEASLIAEKFNIPMVSTGASAEEIWSRGLTNIFGTDTPADDYLEGLYFAADAGVKTVAFVYAKTDFGEDLAAASKRKMEERGLQLVLIEGYPPEQRDFAALAKRLGEANADLIFGVSYFDDSVALVRALKKEGVNPKMLGFTVGPGCANLPISWARTQKACSVSSNGCAVRANLARRISRIGLPSAMATTQASTLYGL